MSSGRMQSTVALARTGTFDGEVRQGAHRPVMAWWLVRDA